MLDQDDPELVTSGLPAYLLFVDGLITQHPENVNLLSAGAQLFAVYGSRFATPGARGRADGESPPLRRARDLHRAHSRRAAGARRTTTRSSPSSARSSASNSARSIPTPSVGSAISQATSEDWGAVADLPRVEAVLERALALDETYEHGAIHGYLGILGALRPPALGGKPDEARAHFERAIELSGGKDLSIKVEYARRYARLVFDQELHDRLLTEVLNSPTEAPKLTLFNVLAKKEAEGLLATSKEYF